MKRLDISPIPHCEAADEARPLRHAADGFVDDSVVLALVTAAARHTRNPVAAVEMIECSALDYAGWAFVDSSGMRSACAH